MVTRSAAHSADRAKRPLGGAELSLHNRMILSAPRPKHLLKNSPLEHVYKIDLEPSGKVRHGKLNVNFDQIVGPGAESLLHPENCHDLITAKLCTLLNIAPGVGCVTSGKSLENRNRSLISMMRWRNEQGIRSMSRLNQAFLRKYAEDIRYGQEGLLPFAERAHEYINRLTDEQLGLPTKCDSRPWTLNWRQIARELGLSEPMGLPMSARIVVVEHLKTYDRALYETEAAKITLKELDYEEFRITEARAHVLLAPWQFLWEFREYLPHDPLPFSPFSSDNTRLSLAKAIGREVAMTRDIPPVQACHLLDHALRWVLEYGDGIVEVLEKAAPALMDRSLSVGAKWRVTKKLLTGLVKKAKLPLKISPTYQMQRQENGGQRTIGLRTLVYELLVSACFIILAAFTARRRGELESLQIDCIEYDEDGAWLISWIEKTIRDIDRTPVPNGVAKAIQLLRRIDTVTSAGRRDSWLFRLVEPTDTSRILKFHPNRSINLFAEIVGVPALPTGEKWQFACHQFRRLFAITYFWRLGFPSLTALSVHFRHFDIEMTLRYLLDLVDGRFLEILEERRASEAVRKNTRRALADARTRREDFKEVGTSYLAHKILDALAGSGWIGGKGGAVLMERVREAFLSIKSEIVIVPGRLESESEVNKLVYDVAREVVFHPHPAEHSLCMFGSSPEDQHLAQCLRMKAKFEGEEAVADASSPAKEYAENLVCAGCMLGLQVDDTRPYWTDARDHERALAEKGPTKGIRSCAADRALAIDRIMEDWGWDEHRWSTVFVALSNGINAIAAD